MKKNIFLIVVLQLILVGSVYAGEIDILLRKLVEKGILTPGEAQEIKVETQEEVKKEVVQGKSYTLPQWVQNTKLKGDFRLRYQYDHTKKLPTTTSSNNTHRARIRARVGLESKINEKVLLGVGIATGKTDATTIDKDTARSSNITLGNGFSKKSIGLDLAYGQYSPFSWLTLVGGKFKNPLWQPWDLIWDTDINPEGGAIKIYKNITPNTDLFVNTGVLVIDEGACGADPTMYVIQPGINQKITEGISFKTAVSYYGFSGVKGKCLDGNTGTNSNTTGTTTGRLLYNYQNIISSSELVIKEPFQKIGISIPYLSFFGEYVKNVESQVPKSDSGYMIGFNLGTQKIEKWADWQVKYNYARLEKDSILDILPDSDRYNGKTGMKAHEFIFDWGLAKNTWLGINYYYGEQLKGNFSSTQSKPASVLQVDWNMKF